MSETPAGSQSIKAVLQYRASAGFRRDLLAASPEWLEVVVVDERDTESFASEMRDSDVLLHVLEPVTEEVFAGAPELKLVQKIGVGVNTIDLDAARKHGVAAANMPGTNSSAVAEMTLLLMLATLRRITMVDAETKQGRGWQLEPETYDHHGEIAGRTVGLVGYGAVPRVFAPILKAMGAEVLYTATAPKPDAVGEFRSLADLLAESDVVSLHIPLTSETDSMFTGELFASMKPGSILINTARGGLVNESDLVSALQSGHLMAAGLDVFAEEPVHPSSELLGLPNVVVTPHIAWLTPETLKRSIHVCVENCRRVRDGEPLLHQVQ